MKWKRSGEGAIKEESSSKLSKMKKEKKKRDDGHVVCSHEGEGA